jgi:hypothetical protein
VFFGERIAGRGLWPPRSPDFTPPDFFLWGFRIERVYSNNPQSLEELKHNTEQTVVNTDQETLPKVANTKKRIEKVVDIFRICCEGVL